MQYAQRTAILAMLTSMQQQMDTVKLLLNIQESAPPMPAMTSRSQRSDPDERYTSEEEDRQIERMMQLKADRAIDREQTIVRRMVEANQNGDRGDAAGDAANEDAGPVG